MTPQTLKPEPRVLEAPDNATRTSDYEISEEARAAYLAALERADDLLIALEVGIRDQRDSGERMELDDFIREASLAGPTRTPTSSQRSDSAAPRSSQSHFANPS